MNELGRLVIEERADGFVAEALGESAFTQAEAWEELHTNVREAAVFYFVRPAPTGMRSHLVRNEVLGVKIPRDLCGREIVAAMSRSWG